MSTNDPSQPEYLGSDGPAPGSPDGARARPRRRTGLLAGVVVATVAAVGAGAYGVLQLMSGGSSPASAVPASAIGYVSLDLDPSAAQKIEAVKILRKFPGLRSELDISSRDDLRRTIFREIQDNSDCKSLDYADDVEPWIGNRVAMAAVPGSGDEVLPLVALQVTDQDKAEAGVRALQKCAGDKGVKLGIASVGDYLLLSEKQADADSMAKAAGSAALEDDDDFTTWMDRTGGSGIVTMYAAKGAADAIVHAGVQSQDSTQGKQLETALRDFEGAAGVVRFKDGAVEAEFSSKGLDQGLGGTDGDRGPDVTTLPGTTAAVLSLALQDGWLDGSMDSLRSLLGDSFDSTLAQAEQRTGLDLPEDVETLLGEGVSISVDSSVDPKAIAQTPDPTDIPAGIRIKGDADKITAIIDKLKAAAGPGADVLQVGSSGDLVAVSTDKAYVDALLEKGDLGDAESFTAVVPEADRASAVFFLDFDAGDGWAEKVADLASDGDASVRENVKPLDAFGISSWQEGDVQHALLRLTTD
jgi:hypothetical protein